MASWKMFVQKSKKAFTDVRLQRFAAEWVKPYNVAFLVFPSVFIIFFLLLTRWFFVISAGGETLPIICVSFHKIYILMMKILISAFQWTMDVASLYMVGDLAGYEFDVFCCFVI